MDGRLPSAIGAVLLLLDPADREIVAARIAKKRPGLSLPSAEEAKDRPDLAIVTFRPPEKIGRFPSAPWVHCAGAGVDKLLSGLPFRPPLITRTVGKMGAQIAEWAIAYIFEDLQIMAERRGLQAKRHWGHKRALPRGFLFEQEILILGTGEIGTAVARALTALGAQVDGVSRSGTKKAPFRAVYAQDALGGAPLSRYGVVISLLPATPETRGQVDEGLLCALDDALFLSAGRGETVSEKAVEAALGAGALRRAVLDVFEDEPLKRDWFLWDHPRVAVTPHVSGVTRAVDTADAFLECLAAVERGERPALTIDPERGY